MFGIILAAGKSSRLGDITKDTPKCLLDISGKCSLGRMIENLTNAGVRKIVIVVGFQSEKIREFLCGKEELPECSIKLIENENWETTNNAYSLNLALDYTQNEEVIVCNGDVVCYKDLIKEVIECPLKDTLAYVRKKELNEEDMKISICDDYGFIKAIDKKLSVESSKGEFTGIFKFHAVQELKLELERALKWDINCWFERALNEYCMLHAVKALDVSHYPYIEIDFPEDLEVARDRFHYDLPIWEQGRRQESIAQGKRDIKNCIELMKDFRDVLDKYKIRYWLNWGLLLGCVREGQPLQYDTDLDICIDKHNEELLWEKVVPEMKKLRCFVPDRNLHCDNDCFIMREGEAIECNTVEKIGNEYVYSPERCKLSCPAHHIDTLNRLIVKGKIFYIPSNVDDYLKGWYGNWKVPSNTKPKSF